MHIADCLLNTYLPVTEFCTIIICTSVFLYWFYMSIAIRIYSAIHIAQQTQHYAMWQFYAAAIPLFHLIIPLGFFGSFYFTHIRNKCCKKHHRSVRVENDQNGTAPASERRTAPSSTFFDVSYTNGFTSIGENESTPLKTNFVSFVIP